MMKNWENNGAEEIGLVPPPLDLYKNTVLLAGIVLCMHSANKRWHYTVMPYLIG